MPDCDDFDDLHSAVGVLAVDDSVRRVAADHPDVDLPAIREIPGHACLEGVPVEFAIAQVGETLQDDQTQGLIGVVEATDVLLRLREVCELPDGSEPT